MAVFRVSVVQWSASLSPSLRPPMHVKHVPDTAGHLREGVGKSEEMDVALTLRGPNILVERIHLEISPFEGLHKVKQGPMICLNSIPETEPRGRVGTSV